MGFNSSFITVSVIVALIQCVACESYDCKQVIRGLTSEFFKKFDDDLIVPEIREEKIAFFCMFKEKGYLNESGSAVNVDALRRADVQKIYAKPYDECDNLPIGADKVENVYNFLLCLINAVK